MAEVLIQVVWRRRFALLWWSLGILGVDGLLAVAYPTVRDNNELDKTFAALPPAVQAALGLQAGALTSPAGYLNSQFFANLLPVLLLVFAIGLGAWAISGDEGSGTLELLLSNPISRIRVSIERAVALALTVTLLTAVAGLGLVALAPLVGLDRGLSFDRILEAAAATELMAMTFAALAFATGAASGSRGAAVSVASAAAVALFMVEGLAEQVRVLQPIREASPWHWLLGTDPIRQGLLWHSWVLPIVVSAVLVTCGTVLFARRDLR